MISKLPASFDANEYFSAAEYDGDKVYLDVSDDRFEKYQNGDSGGMCYSCRTESYYKKLLKNLK